VRNDLVESTNVLPVHQGNPLEIVKCGFVDTDHLSSDAFDCVILTQTYVYVFDLRVAVRMIHHVFRPGGVVLAILPCASPIHTDEWTEPWCWGLAERSARLLFAGTLPDENVRTDADGNVLALRCCAQEAGVTESTTRQRNHRDISYPTGVTDRAVNPIEAA
jgi:SAM-dependent methyltransferase